MCGISGILYPTPVPSVQSIARQVGAMNDALVHRGPNDEGVWTDDIGIVGLGQRRLSIIDLSVEGHQPMVSSSGRFIITFNGEIYNYEEIRGDLASHNISYRGKSDTEVLLAAIETWGIEKAVEHANGMFAFAVWDAQQRQLWLGRDRLGQKPLYYGWAGSAFVFASELKAISKVEGFRSEIERNVVPLFLRHAYVPEPWSIFCGVRKLMPGTILTMNWRDMHRQALPDAKPYWQLRDVARRGHDDLLPDCLQTLDDLEALLSDAVTRCMLSDVPLGAFLSGGIDSSVVAALMQASSETPVRTFSIGFHEAQYNEAVHAADVAKHLKTKHTELYVTQQQARDVIQDLPQLYDEPFADSSQIPTFLVSRMARDHVTVALSGDGGDEVFGGYNRYTWAQNIANAMRYCPNWLRSATSGFIQSVPVSTWDSLSACLPRGLRRPLWGDKAHKLAGIISAQTPEEAYSRLTSQWQSPRQVALDATEPKTSISQPELWPGLPDFQSNMMALDAETYLPGDILTKVDRASMGTSLESRVPLLDHRVIEFSWRLPTSMKIRNGVGKWALRQVLYRHVPQNLIERPKMGFGVPIGAWLRHELRDWAEELLDEKRLDDDGFFDPAPIRACWHEHLSGRRNLQHQLWTILMFQAWRASRFGGLS